MIKKPKRKTDRQKIDGLQLAKLLKHNEALRERYKNDSAYRAKFYKEEVCRNCGKVNMKRKANANGFCDEKCLWEYNKNNDPILWKARSLSANIVGGRGKLAWCKALIRDALGQSCKYCGAKLTLENISLDHKIAIGKSNYRRKKRPYAKQRQRADTYENLQIICKKCNHIKGNLNDDEYEALLNFLDSHESLKDKVLKRLGAGQTWLWRH